MRLFSFAAMAAAGYKMKIRAVEYFIDEKGMPGKGSIGKDKSGQPIDRRSYHICSCIRNMKNKSIFSRNNLFLILIIITGLIVRLFTYPQVIEQDRIVFLETDPYYHMWRVFSYIDTFPKTFFYDGYINFPYGTLVGWPPFFDQVIAVISIIIGGKPGGHLVEYVGAYMPVVQGIFTIASIYFITKELFSERAALFGSLLIAVMPAHSQISFLGFTDHHVAEVLLMVAAYMFFIRALNDSTQRSAIISGILIGISFLTWQGAPIFTGILLFYSIVQFILDKKSGVISNYLVITGTTSFLSAFLIIMIFYIWVPWQHTITAWTLSYFQPLFLILSIITIALSGLISNSMKKSRWQHYAISMIALFAGIFLLINIAAPSLYNSISGGVSYLLRDMPVLKQISEAQPLFYTYDGKFLGWQIFNNPVWNAFTFSFYFAIIGMVWFLHTCKKSMNKGNIFFLIWTMIVLVLALYQRRFTYLLSANIAMISGFFIDEILKKSISFHFTLFHPDTNSKKIIPPVISSLFILILVIPNIAMSYGLSQNQFKPSDDWYDSLIWLRDNTPEIENEPQYGIMAWWDYGNWILYISRRPVVANNFQIGGDESAKFFITPDETYANTIMNKRKARYVIVEPRMGFNKFKQGDQYVIKGTFKAVAGFADTDISLYLDKNNLPNQNYFQTMYARMHVFDGYGLKNYRMIYESNETNYNLFDKPTRNIKIFEYIKGAKIIGKASSNNTAVISGQIITNQERIFDYMEEVKSNKDGIFELVVPYSTDSPYKTRLLNGYNLRYDNSTIPVEVSENDVMRGNIIEMN